MNPAINQVTSPVPNIFIWSSRDGSGFSHPFTELLKKKKNVDKSREVIKQQTTQKPRTIPQNGDKIMDSPDLDNRILRKAETALQLRTSRLIIVVERCTNDHNSAILQTADALGVQHVYIISPQACNATLRIDVGGDAHVGIAGDAVGDDENKNIDLAENVKLHRSNGQQVKRYSEAEVKDRANHHLFAQRALEWIEEEDWYTGFEGVFGG